jgi:hypothetical protein
MVHRPHDSLLLVYVEAERNTLRSEVLTLFGALRFLCVVSEGMTIPGPVQTQIRTAV